MTMAEAEHSLTGLYNQVEGLLLDNTDGLTVKQFHIMRAVVAIEYAREDTEQQVRQAYEGPLFINGWSAEVERSLSRYNVLLYHELELRACCRS